MAEALLLLTALAACIAGMGWLALSLNVHWRQVHGNAQQPAGRVRCLRMQGVAGLAASLVPCLAAANPSIASLLWIMLLSTAALMIAFTLTRRAHWLRLLSSP